MKNSEIKQIERELTCRFPLHYFKDIKKMARLKKIIVESQQEYQSGITDSLGLSIRRRSKY